VAEIVTDGGTAVPWALTSQRYHPGPFNSSEEGIELDAAEKL
jgi:hypothetical protein